MKIRFWLYGCALSGRVLLLLAALGLLTLSNVSTNFDTRANPRAPPPPSPPPPPPALPLALPGLCCGSAANTIALAFRYLRQDGSGCPSEDYFLAKLRDADPDPRGKTFVNIGFNKGYKFVFFASGWSWGDGGLNASSWHGALHSFARSHAVKFYPGVLCGLGCNDCTEPHNATKIGSVGTGTVPIRQDEIPLFIGIDLNVQNVKLFEGALQATSQPLQSIRALVFAGAISNVSDALDVTVPDCELGDENCSIKRANVADSLSGYVVGVNASLVPAYSFDGLLRDWQRNGTLPKRPQSHSDAVIDFLYVDVEGFDALVLSGAGESIRRGQVRVVLFEYSPWLQWSLSLHEMLSVLLPGMQCYYMGQRRLWKLSGDCFSPVYSARSWSNIICVKSSDIWAATLDGLAVTAADAASILEGVAVTQEVGRHVKGASGEIWFMDGGTGQRMPIKDWESYLAKKLPSQPKPFPLQDHILRLFPVAQAPASALKRTYVLKKR